MKEQNFRILIASQSLRNLAENKDPLAVAELADFSMEPESEVDVFQAGVRIGLLMAAQGKYTAVQIDIHEGDEAMNLCFIGTQAEARKKIAALEDVEDEETH